MVTQDQMSNLLLLLDIKLPLEHLHTKYKINLYSIKFTKLSGHGN
jgi:hypothetical protein